jgi:dihydroorotate dehydrogenase
VSTLRDRWGDQLVIVGSGGIHEPADALAFFAAGATLVQLHSGLVYAGPGLPKRINDALAYCQAEAVGGRAQVPEAGGGTQSREADPRPGSPEAGRRPGSPDADPRPSPPAVGRRPGRPEPASAIAASPEPVTAKAAASEPVTAKIALPELPTTKAASSEPATANGASSDPARPESAPPEPAGAKDAPRGWAWTALLGAGLVLGGLLAWLVAATLVLLPYDEWFLGLSRGEVAALNERLILFMVHDRVTLAGNMVALGLLYLSLAVFAVRAGMCWARDVVRLSGAVGIASLLLFLGFGYLDPLHALATLVLLVFFLLGLRGPLPRAVYPYPNLHSDRRWLAGLWGQLILVAIGAGVLATGIALAVVGVTTTFVPEDLAFLQTTRPALEALNPRLIPLIAHDRAGLGGLLMADGLAWLLTALWGFRQGARWLWWTFLASGTVRFLAALGTHFAVGYTDTWHLAPVVASLLMYACALVLSYGYLAAPRPLAHPLSPK